VGSIALFDIPITESGVRQHSHQQMKMVPHYTKAHNFSKIEFTEPPQQSNEVILFQITHGIPVQGGPRYHMIGGWVAGY
jgi:hypothetical protein